MLNKYEEFSFKRKELIANNEAPKWYSTAGYQLLVNKNYLLPGETPKGMYTRISKHLGKLVPTTVQTPDGYTSWQQAFFDVMWKGWLSPATPELANIGTNRGMAVSCSGSHMEDSIDGFYTTRREIALMTKEGFGCSTCMDPIRSRGTPISKGGKASGIMQPASGIVQDMKEVSQGSTRRGAAAIYINPLHEDFDEIIDQLMADDDGWNIGWNITDAFEELFQKDPVEADRRWKRMLKAKLVKGKGYFVFIDKANRQVPKMYKDKGLTIKHSQLCSEILLFNDKEHTYTCVLASMNVAKYDEWKDTNAVYIATVFLDTVITDFLNDAKNKPGFERAVKFTEKTRAIGLGVMGLSTYYQEQNWVFGDLQSTMFNQTIFKKLNTETLEASKYLAKVIGEPEYMKGYGERFSHRIAVAPTMSTSTIMGGVSAGIEPVTANIYEQDTAGGTVFRINPTFLALMKKRGMYTKEVMQRITEDNGSVQAEEWLTPYEKEVFRTAYEVSQYDIIRMASQRQQYIDQGQSTNLYFQADADEYMIADVHDKAFKDENILSLYYIRSLNKAGKVKINAPECAACDG